MPIHFNGQTLTDRTVTSVGAFSAFWAMSIVAISLALAAMGMDFMTSVSASMTAVANVGPGLTDAIGPAGNFAGMPDAAKWILSFGMLLGRLEILTVLVLFIPGFWRS